MSCIPDLPATNPISDLLMSVLGENFFPPYDPNFQPTDRGKMTNEKFLQMQIPGGGKLRPIGDPKHVHLSEYLTPITGLLGGVFAFFGPLFIVLDVIRAIIDVICALFNPVPVILTLVDLFINVVPPLIALYPPLSSILHALNAAKLVVSIVGSLVSALIPIIFEVVEAALSIPAELESGNIGIIDTIEIKICELLADFANQIGGLAPIKFILEILEIFMSLGSKFFCTQDAACCNSENCPPIIINPAQGEMVVLNTIYKFTLKDLVDAIAQVVNPSLEFVSDVINDFLTNAFSQINNAFNSIRGTIDGFVNVLEGWAQDLVDGSIVLMIDAINWLIGFAGGIISTIPSDAISLDLPEIPNLPDLPVPPTVDLTIQTPDEFEDVVFVQPLMTLEYKSAVSGPNENGLTSIVGVGHNYTATELANYNNYIVPPDTLPVPLPPMPSFLSGEQGDDAKKAEPATIRMKLRNKLGSDIIKRVTAEEHQITSTIIALENDRICDNSGVIFSYLKLDREDSPVVITKPDGSAHPAFETEVALDPGPKAIGEYAVSYTTGAIVVNDVVQDLELNRDFVVNYMYLSNTSVKEVTVPVTFHFPTFEQIANTLLLNSTQLSELLNFLGFGYLPQNWLGIVQVKDDSFPEGTVLEYEFEPDQIELIKHNLIGLGCQNDIRSASEGLAALINADAPFGTTGLDPLIDKTGKPFPTPPERCFLDLLEQLTADPTVYVDPVKCLTDYLDDLSDFVDRILCVGASSVNSVFDVSKTFVQVGNGDKSVLSLRIKDAGGNDLLVGGLVPGSQFRAQFETTLGTVGPVEFDADSGTFFAALTSDEVGEAEVTAKLIVRDEVCMTSSSFNNFEVTPEIKRVQFVSRTTHPRLRREPQYVQARGGRKR